MAHLLLTLLKREKQKMFLDVVSIVFVILKSGKGTIALAQRQITEENNKRIPADTALLGRHEVNGMQTNVTVTHMDGHRLYAENQASGEKSISIRISEGEFFHLSPPVRKVRRLSRADF